MGNIVLKKEESLRYTGFVNYIEIPNSNAKNEAMELQ